MSANNDAPTPTPEGEELIRPIIDRMIADDVRLQGIIMLYVQNFVPNERKFLLWHCLSGRRRKEIFEQNLRPGYLLEMFSAYFGDLLELNTAPKISIDTDPEFEKELGWNVRGDYNLNHRGDGGIIINDNMLDESFYDEYNFVATLAHEMWHDYQTECGLNYQALSVTTLRVTPQNPNPTLTTYERYGKIIRDNGVNYKKPSTTNISQDGEYQEQDIEEDARYFSTEFMTIFRPRFETQETAERERLRAAEMEEEKLLREKKRIEKHHLKMNKSNLKKIEEMIKEEDMEIRKRILHMT